MKRQLLVVSALAFAMLGLTSCGSKYSKNAESAATIETVQDTDKTESSSKEIEPQSETVVSEIPAETATENNGDKYSEDKVIWYMDSEGVKNDDLGIVIRKNNDEGRVLEIQAHLSWRETGQAEFYCDYYDGDIDTYISEHPIVYGTYHIPEWDVKQKASINNVEYAYAIGDSGSALVTFVGNGIAVSTVLFYDENETYEDALNKLWNEKQCIKLCDEFKMDCLAYLTDDGMYCPALGMEFTSADYTDLCVRSWEDPSFSNRRPAEITFRESDMGFMVDAENAQDAVKKLIEIWKKDNEEYENVSIGKIEPRNFGKYTYYGAEKIYSFGSGANRFFADNAGWYIDYSYDEMYKDYIDCIENLE